MIAETFIKAELARVAYQEAHHYGGVDSMLAIVYVMKNRVDAGWFGGEWMDVLQRHYEASAYEATEMQPINVRDLQFRILLQKIDGVYDGSEPDHLTDGALFYCELTEVTREWFVKNVLQRRESHPRCASVGPLTFFQ